MKKLLFAAYSLEIGGIEKSLVELLNHICRLGFYDITLVLEKKEGAFLDELNDRIKIIEYTPSTHENEYIRKMINLCKRIKFILKYYNKFDFSAAFATYSLPANFAARMASGNSALWVHTNYLKLLNGDKKKFEEFFNERKYFEFPSIIFVSEDSRNAFLEVFPDYKNATTVCGHYLNYNNILNKSNEKIDDLNIDKTIPTFVNIGRHSEEEKKLSRLLEAANKLKEDGCKFNLVLVGDGPDTDTYKRTVTKYDLDKYVKFVGKKSNPYPYYKIADCMVLTSEFEGFPVVFLESEIFNKPIITTDVSDYQKIENKYGIVTQKNEESIYKAMKSFIENGYEIKEKFDIQSYNKEVLDKLQTIFDDKK